MNSFEETVVGAIETLGSHTFTADDIIAFARQFDPQPFHLSEEGGRATHFGGLVASGWHTGAMWMRLRVDSTVANNKARAEQGLSPRRNGPSPGFKNLKWPKPVRPGDTITYYSEVTGKRLLDSRPGWGIMFALNTGVNQRGELVFSFDGTVLLPTE
jgi:acyl dehydratase